MEEHTEGKDTQKVRDISKGEKELANKTFMFMKSLFDVLHSEGRDWEHSLFSLTNSLSRYVNDNHGLLNIADDNDWNILGCLNKEFHDFMHYMMTNYEEVLLDLPTEDDEDYYDEVEAARCEIEYLINKYSRKYNGV
jgi:hypothetical protein